MKNAGNTGLRFALTPLALSAALFIAACGGDGDSTPVTPTIAAQPAEQSVVAGRAATFSVTASGDSLTYQWQRSTDGGATWADIASATAATYTVDSADAGASGTQYRVVISGGGQSVTSSPVKLTVTAAVAAPVLSVDVAAVAVTAGADAVFSVTATGTSLAYQWQVSADGTAFTDVPGATAATLTLPAVALTDSGKSVRVAVTNSAGTVTSSAAALDVTPAVVDATIVAQPASASTTAPATVTFTVGATGTPAPTYQWQTSVDGGTTWVDIAGATGASYTTGATALAESGSLFRVSVSNATATAVSDPATLTVAAGPVPVTITAQPTAIAVTVPSTATFAVAATGSPTPTYQWQVKGTAAGSTFANITGATSASYTTPATVAADSGKQFQVVVTNGSGSVTSAPVTLTATAATTASNLTGRAWTTGASLETGDASVSTVNPSDPVVGIDDAGNAISVFTKSDGTRSVLYATRGVPGATGAAPVWSAPVAIDTAVSPAGTSTRLLTVAPNGNAAVTWLSKAPCTASTYSTSVNATCNYLNSSRYSAATNSWSAPAQMADTPNLNFAPTQFFNDEGDLAVAYPGWVRNGNSFTTKPAVLWQAAGQSAFQSRVFSELGNFALGMDKGGNLVVAGDATQNSTTDLVAYRGSVSTGFGAQELLEQRTSAATYDNLAVGSNGQAIVTWYQNNGTSKTRFAASIDGPTAPWVAQDIGNEYNLGGVLTVTDAGVGVLSQPCFLGSTGAFQRFSGGTWSGWQKYPSALNGCYRTSITFNRNADILLFDSSDWTSYDAARNQVIRANTSSATSVYGTSGGSMGSAAAALSLSGIGVLTVAVPYDTLPTVAQPAGDGRNSVVNLWGLFLK